MRRLEVVTRVPSMLARVAAPGAEGIKIPSDDGVAGERVDCDLSGCDFFSMTVGQTRITDTLYTFGPVSTTAGGAISTVVLELNINQTWCGDLVAQLYYDVEGDGTIDLGPVAALCRPNLDLCPFPDGCCGCSGDLAGAYTFGDDALEALGDPNCPSAITNGCYLPAPESVAGFAATFGGAPSGGDFYLEIGDGNVFRGFVTVTRAPEEGGVTRIGDGNLLMAYVHIAHNCVLGDHVILANAVNLAGHVQIDDYAIVGGVTPVHQFVRIGRHAFIGGGSRVPQDVPPYIRCAGNPLRVGGLNSVGLKRRNFTEPVLQELKRAYRLVYRSNLNVSQALARLRAELRWLPEVEEFTSFIAASERGIVK